MGSVLEVRAGSWLSSVAAIEQVRHLAERNPERRQTKLRSMLCNEEPIKPITGPIALTSSS